MKYKRFEDLPVWQDAGRVAAKMFRWCNHPEFRGKGDLGNQLQRAALSISNNIAEGFERGTNKELINYLYIARGSAGEVRSMLCVMNQMPEFDALKSDISELRGKCESISRQLGAWTKSLQNSSIQGERYLNDRSREQYQRTQKKKQLEQDHRQWRETMETNLKKKLEESREKKNDFKVQISISKFLTSEI